MSLTAFSADATAQVKGYSESNEDPKKGAFALALFDATFTGGSEGQALTDLSPVLVGTDAVQYTNDDCGASLGDGDLSSPPTVETGERVIGFVCFDAPTASIAGAVLFVEDSTDFTDAARLYWKL